VPIDLVFPPRIRITDRPDRRIAKDISHHCSSLAEIVVLTLLTLGWEYRAQEYQLVASHGAVSMHVLDHLSSICCADRLQHVLDCFNGFGWEREMRMIWMAYEELPAYVRLAEAMRSR